MIKIGETLFLDIKKPGQETMKYKCKVENKSEGSLFVTYPTNIHTDKSEFFMLGTRFNAHFTTKEKQTFTFQTEMIDRKKEKIPLLVLSFPSEEELKKIQRRAFVRVDSAMDISIHPIDNQFKPFTASTIDISAGGCAVMLPEHHPLKENMEVFCWLVLPLKDQYRYLKRKVKVVRIFKGENQKREQSPLQFLDMSGQDRQLILRFCFEEQLTLKKKGLL